jgi:hypothetical protein
VVTTPDGVLYTAQIPLRMDGSIETGDIAAQAKLTFNNLKLTVEAAGRHALIIGLMRLSQNMPFVAPQSGVIEIIRPRLGPGASLIGRPPNPTNRLAGERYAGERYLNYYHTNHRTIVTQIIATMRKLAILV